MGMIEDILNSLNLENPGTWASRQLGLGGGGPGPGGASDAVGAVMEPPPGGGDILADLGTGGGAAPPGLTPEEEALYTEYGYADQIPFIAQMGVDERSELNKKIIESGPPVKPESKNYDIEKLVKLFPEEADYIRAAPPGAIPNIISNLMARRNAKPTKEPWAADREAAVRAIPELAPYIDSMSDSDVSQAMQEAFESAKSAGPDGIAYEDVKGAPKIRIMQDAAFQRSGLKSGDTVCVRIP